MAKEQTRTVAVLIGNSDDKLGQKEWSEYVKMVRDIVQRYADPGQVHFCGCSNGDAAWQNWCIVAGVPESLYKPFKLQLLWAREKFRQDSIALVAGQTEFI